MSDEKRKLFFWSVLVRFVSRLSLGFGLKFSCSSSFRFRRNARSCIVGKDERLALRFACVEMSFRSNICLYMHVIRGEQR